MDQVERNRSRARRAGRRLALIAALALSACVNPAFRETTGQFGAVTKKAVSQQNDRLASIASDEDERIRAGLASNRRILFLDPVCGTAVALPSGAGDPNAPAAPCRLVLQGNNPIEEAPKFQNILALSSALTDYADGLIALTSDASADQQAFTTSLSGLATSLGGLDGAIQKATGATPADRSAKLGAVATLIAEAGNLYFAHRRDNALKRIVLAGDPLVQEAVGLLSGVGSGIDLYDRSVLAQHLAAAVDRAQIVAADQSQRVDSVRAAQDAVFEAVDAYNNYGVDRRQFRDIGIAHAKLAEAARRGASLAELKAAVEAVGHLASTANTTLTTLKGKSGSSGNANQNQ
ncbi:MAG TPA: hypothetical protein VGD66_12800 [Allosphingosinicella sp.]|jgi:hypothetical protein